MKWIPLAMAFATSTSLLATPTEADTPSEPSSSASPEFVISFDNSDAEPEWRAVNDNVMGGFSKGEGTLQDGTLLFEGDLSLKNNGGFASVRTPTQRSQYNFTGTDGITLRVKGDGRTYQLRLASDARHRGSLVSYQCKFETEADKWTEVKVPFDEMKPSWRGRMLNGHVLDVSQVSQLGLLIGDKREGPFRLEVDWLKTFRGPTEPRDSSIRR